MRVSSFQYVNILVKSLRFILRVFLPSENFVSICVLTICTNRNILALLYFQQF